MSEVKLLPLPKLPEKECDELGCEWLQSRIEAYATDYARANLAERDAEVEALRAEVDQAQASARVWRRLAETCDARAERLAGALREAFKAMQRSYHSDVRILFHELGAVMDVSTELGIRLCAPPEALRGEQEQAALNPTAAQENDDA